MATGRQLRPGPAAAGGWLALAVFCGCTFCSQATAGDGYQKNGSGRPVGASPSVSAPGATWVVDPSHPGSDLPPRGRSLFDRLIAERQGESYVYQIPFPFSALRDRLLQQLRPGRLGESPLREVLIPLGRSLQRMAAAPEFFRFPRVVLAVDGESGPAPGFPGIHFKDRLYLGYIEHPGVLEVISYNEEGGRFEFQIVKNYREGARPEVVYATRAVCIACHQNATPIFSRPLWGETNADDSISKLLQAEQRDFYGIPIASGIDAPAAIDAATDRANLVPLVLLLWSDGCQQSGTEAVARRCRARALGYALQFRLTGSTWFMDGAQEDWQSFSTLLETAAKRSWPDGLLVSSPDIPNRVPITQDRPAAVSGARLPNTRDDTQGRLIQQMHIPAVYEPLQPRPPLEWVDAAGIGGRLVTGLADFVAEVDIERLDQALYQLGSERAAHRIYRGLCHLSPRKRKDGEYRVSFGCEPRDESDPGGLRLKGRLYLKDDRISRGVIDEIAPTDDAGGRGIEIREGLIEQTGTGARIRLLLSHGGLQARLGSGNAIEDLVIDWPWPATGTPTEPLTPATLVAGEMRVLQDFSLLDQAMAEMLAAPAGDDDLFSDAPFRRQLMLQTLFPRLGMALAHCCPTDAELPPARADDSRRQIVPGGSAIAGADTPEAVFYSHCSRCHLTHERFPPNFLYGDPARVQANLAHCAERLYLRLRMWSLPVDERPKTPMPPIHALPMLDLDEAHWRKSQALEELLSYVGTALQRQTGAAPKLEDLMDRGYENLRGCLASDEQESGLHSEEPPKPARNETKG